MSESASGFGGDKPGAALEYVLGHSPKEIDRLKLQARRVDPITRRIFECAGIQEGMRVLDVGSGAGDVAILVADLAGPPRPCVELPISRWVLPNAPAV